jgi:serine phosphatase RsbU (regulator of sigma subunit)
MVKVTQMAEAGRSLGDALTVGVAIVNKKSWQIEYENRQFREWFSEPSEERTLTKCIGGFKEDRALKRLSKGRSFVFEFEFRVGARATVLRVALRETEAEEGAQVLVEVVDITKQKEQEHMLDSFSKLADRNKRELEKTNSALSKKTADLVAANDIVRSQKDRMERELEIARQVQMNMLPRDFVPNHKECTLAGALTPALEVGGDFFDYFYVDKSRLCFLVGDVSDKGAASGLFAAAAKTMLKAHAIRAESTAGIISRVNRELSVNNETCMFVTLFLGIIDLETGKVIVTNAGHNPPYRVTTERKVETFAFKNGPAVGISDLLEYSENELTLLPGDLILVYTDGVTEATNADMEFFGEERLEKLFADVETLSAELVVREIMDAVAAFENGTPQSDDVTVIAIKYHGP